jgi:hypothetical protein
MFRALLCSSSEGQIVFIQLLVSSRSVGGRPVHRTATYIVTIPDPVLVQYDLLMMSKTVLETCREIINLL